MEIAKHLADVEISAILFTRYIYIYSTIKVLVVTTKEI